MRGLPCCVLPATVAENEGLANMVCLQFVLSRTLRRGCLSSIRTPRPHEAFAQPTETPTKDGSLGIQHKAQADGGQELVSRLDGRKLQELCHECGHDWPQQVLYQCPRAAGLARPCRLHTMMLSLTQSLNPKPYLSQSALCHVKTLL